MSRIIRLMENEATNRILDRILTTEYLEKVTGCGDFWRYSYRAKDILNDEDVDRDIRKIIAKAMIDVAKANNYIYNACVEARELRDMIQTNIEARVEEDIDEYIAYLQSLDAFNLELMELEEELSFGFEEWEFQRRRGLKWNIGVEKYPFSIAAGRKTRSRKYVKKIQLKSRAEAWFIVTWNCP